MRQFVSGFLLAALIFGSGAAWLLKRADDQPIRWPPSFFYDQVGVVPEAGYLRVTGSLIGEDMRGSTFLDVACYGEQMVCRITELQQFGSYRQVNLWTDQYSITSWEKDQVVAESSPPATACNRVRLVLDRVAKATHYYRIPNPLAERGKCAAMFSKNKVFDWTFGDQPN